MRFITEKTDVEPVSVVTLTAERDGSVEVRITSEDGDFSQHVLTITSNGTFKRPVLGLTSCAKLGIKTVAKKRAADSAVTTHKIAEEEVV